MPDEPQPKDTRLIREITLRNILSFGPDTPPLELKPLNILIGANGSGKSNLIDCIGLMRGTAQDRQTQMAQVRGGYELLHKHILNEFGLISIDIALSSFHTIEHTIEFTVNGHNYGIELQEERVNYRRNDKGLGYYTSDPLKPKLINEKGKQTKVSLKESQFLLGNPYNLSLSPFIAGLSTNYKESRIFRSWQYVNLRIPQSVDVRTDRYEEDLSNFKAKLGLHLASSPLFKNKIIEGLNNLYPSINDINTQPVGSLVQIWFNESNIGFSANRLSDGTLRYLCLLAILCDPAPPPLICIEEPELGLHPDIIGKLADLLVDASTRTQLIVTTHSDILLDALSDHADSVVVCEKHDGKTIIERLDPSRFASFLEKYRLGELWMRGAIGGTRW